jgi:hypothetical protein
MKGPSAIVLAVASATMLTVAGDPAISLQPPSLDPAGVCRMAEGPIDLPEAPEASGVALGRRSPRLLWMHNDSDGAFVLGYDPDGTLRARVRVTGAEVEDWEDLATGSCPAGTCVYVGDVGDNDAERPRITVYRTKEPSAGDRETAPSDVFHAVYPDGPHDAESLLVTPDGAILVATKGEPTIIYRFPRVLANGAVSVLERVLTLDDVDARGKNARRASRLTGGSVSSDGAWIALRSNTLLRFFRTADLMAARTDRAVTVDLGPIDEPQGEGVAFGDNGAVYLVSEGGKKGRPGVLTHLTCRLPR